MSGLGFICFRGSGFSGLGFYGLEGLGASFGLGLGLTEAETFAAFHLACQLGMLWLLVPWMQEILHHLGSR